jgi:hypothetical protein
LNIILTALGIYLIIDGGYSIHRYRTQGFWDHLVRIIRIGVGTIIIAIGVSLG